MVPRLKDRYQKEIVPQLQKELGLSNKMAVPRLEKIVVNMGLGEGAHDHKIIERAAQELSAITGQKPIQRRARKAIANFKIKEGQFVGVKVTLRKAMMYEFLDRLINVALPRIRDFRGVPLTSFDEQGNYSMGLQEQVIFPEIDFDKVDRVNGMNITFCTKAKNPQHALALLKAFGMPFRVQN